MQVATDQTLSVQHFEITQSIGDPRSGCKAGTRSPPERPAESSVTTAVEVRSVECVKSDMSVIVMADKRIGQRLPPVLLQCLALARRYPRESPTGEFATAGKGR